MLHERKRDSCFPVFRFCKRLLEKKSITILVFSIRNIFLAFKTKINRPKSVIYLYQTNGPYHRKKIDNKNI